MGNLLLRGVVHFHGRRIKIKKANGTVMKLQSPVCVKEILIHYPNHEIFEAPAGPPLGMGSFSGPLSERAGLVAGHLYYLIPIPQDELTHYNNNCRITPFAGPSSDHSIPRTSSELQAESSAEIVRDSIKQEADDPVLINKIKKGGVRIVSSSYSIHRSIMRVKLQLRKEELASFLSANNLLLVKNIVAPCLRQRASQQSALPPWKPRLETISEPHSPVGDSIISREDPAH